MSSSRLIIPRAIRMLSQHGADALKASVTNGRYRGPLVSKRIAADIRKKAVIEGTYGDFIPLVGGWDPSWDKTRNNYISRPFKGHKEERNREDRAHKIDVAMKGMPDKIKKYEQEATDRKPNKDIFYQFRRISEISRGMRRKKI